MDGWMQVKSWGLEKLPGKTSEAEMKILMSFNDSKIYNKE